MIPKVYSCLECKGTGTLTQNQPNGGPVVSTPCPFCNATGKKVSATAGVDSTYFDEKFAALEADVAYIKTRVRKIWLKVKDAGDEE